MLDLIAEGLEHVEALLAEEVEWDDESAPLGEIARHVILSGGKRLRPALILASCGAVDGSGPEDAVAYAAVVEMIHTATLIHDDINDDAARRRGRPTANALFGTPRALVTGDYLFARAVDLCGRYPWEVNRILARACCDVAEGEMLQLNSTWDNMKISRYLRIIEKKTASLFAASTMGGAWIGSGGTLNGPAGRLEEYGRAVGMAFQLADDCLDFAGGEETGKPPLQDLMGGKITAPVLHALDGAGPAEWRRLRRFFALRRRTAKDAAEVAALLRGRGSVGATLSLARTYSERAAAALSGLPDTPYRALLAAVGRYTVDRRL